MLLPRTAPSVVAIDPGAVTAFADAVDAAGLGVQAVMVVRHGAVAAEAWWHPYRPDDARMVFSVSKSFTATAAGLAIADGVLGLDEPLVAVFPEYADPAQYPGIAGVTVRHLLTMASGHAKDGLDTLWPIRATGDWLDAYFRIPVDYEPGEKFVYDSGASYVVAAAVVRRTGRSLRDYLGRRLFAPLGIPAPHWETDAAGVELGGIGLTLTVEQLAAFGQLYLRGGVWNGERLVPEAWVEQATSLQIGTPEFAHRQSRQGYGFQFWRSTHGYRADGAFGQFALVLPEQDAVIAIQSGTTAEANDIIDLAFEHLLPGFADDGPDAAAPAPGESLRPGDRRVPDPGFELLLSPREAGFADAAFAVPRNPLGISAVTLVLGVEAVELRCSLAGGGTETLVAGRRGWADGQTALWPYESRSPVPYAAWAGWRADDVLEVHQQLLGTPFRRVWRLELGAEQLLTVSHVPDFWLAHGERLPLTRIA